MSNKTTVQDLIELSEQQDLGKHDYEFQPKQLYVSDEGKLVLPAGDGPFGIAPLSFEDVSLSQLCTKVAPGLHGQKNARLPIDHHRRLLAGYPDLFSDQMNRFLGEINELYPRERWMIRAHDENCRALLSNRYADIPNTELLNLAGEALKSSGDYTIVRPWVSRDRIILKVIVKDLENPIDPEDGGFGIGFMIRNDEIGQGSAVVMPMIQRHSCTNSIVAMTDQYGEKMGVRLIHKGDVTSKMALISGAIAEVMPHALDTLSVYMEAVTEDIPDLSALVADMAKKSGWTEKVKSNVLIGTEGQQTKAGLVNGITYAAHATEGVTQEEALDMEILGGQMLFTAASKLVRRAQTSALHARQREEIAVR